MVTTPAGVSGAVLLLPVQVSVLHVANPALTPTNLLYNVVATPGAILRFARDRRPDGVLTRALLAGTVPGVAIGAVLRVEVFSGPTTFLLVVAAVLAPIGVWLLVGGGAAAGSAPPAVPGRRVPVIAFGAGLVGGLYGIGGGSLIGPALVVLGYGMATVAPAALTTTFVTSVVGVLVFQGLQWAEGDGSIAPVWGLGIAMGIGGLAGGYVGARLQPRVPETALRRLLGAVCLLLAARYALQGAGVL